MAIPYQTAKFKSSIISQWQFRAQLPNLIPANISSDTVVVFFMSHLSILVKPSQYEARMSEAASLRKSTSTQNKLHDDYK